MTSPSPKSVHTEARPFSEAPPNDEFLAWFPLFKLDDDANLTSDAPDEGAQGAWAIVRTKDGVVYDEPDFLSAIGDWFGDDEEYGDPTHWAPLPPPVSPPKPLSSTRGQI